MVAYASSQFEEQYFKSLHHDLRALVEASHPNGARLAVPHDTYEMTANEATFHDFRVQRKIGPFRRPVLTIQPPYTPKDVVLQDKNFRDLAEIVREEII